MQEYFQTNELFLLNILIFIEFFIFYQKIKSDFVTDKIQLKIIFCCLSRYSISHKCTIEKY